MKCSKEQMMELFGMLPPVSEEFIEQVRLDMPGFVFKEKSADKKMIAYCTRCNKYLSVEELVSRKHNDEIITPCCHSPATIKDAGRGHKYLTTRNYVGQFQLLADGMIVLRTFCVNSYFGVDYHNAPIEFSEHYRIFFCRNNKVYSFCKKNTYRENGWKYDWCSMCDIPLNLRYPGIGNGWCTNVEPIFADFYNLDVVSKSEIFRYSDFANVSSKINSIIYLEYLTFYTKHPILTERLVKENLLWILEMYFYGRFRNFCISPRFNFKAETVQGFLRIQKSELKFLKSKTDSQMISNNKKFDCLEHVLTLKATGLPVTEEFYKYAKKAGNYTIRKLKILDDNALQKTAYDFAKYFLRRNINTNDYIDYYGWLERFEIPQTKRTLFPKDFQAQHDYFMKREADERNAEKIRKLAKKQKEFEKELLPKLTDIYPFSDGKFIVRPFVSAKEIIDEGLIQSICVGGEYYLNEHLEGRGVICCCRMADAPDTPYCTIEIVGNNIVQARMRKNNAAPTEVTEFLKKWKKYFTEQKKIIEKAAKQQEVV